MSRRVTTPTRLATAIGFALLLATLWAVLGLTAPNASGVAAKVIGQTPDTPKPSCPTPETPDGSEYEGPEYKRCEGIGEISGLQVRADGEFNPYKVPSNGRLVAWGIDLARPSASEIGFFTDAPASGPSVLNGVGWGDPSARISVLKRMKPGRYKLVKQSPRIPLSEHLGSNPIFTLDKPMKVKAGSLIAITTPTWFPNLAHDEPVATSNEDIWLASRGAEHCGNAPAGASRDEIIAALQDAIENSKPQQKEGTVRSYRCEYSSARLLYRAFYVPE